MGRLIDVQDAPFSFQAITVKVGDLIQFGATGGRVQSRTGVLEMWGPFLPAVVGENGEILTPSSAPNTVFFSARRPGRATIVVISGDQWRGSETTTLEISVES
jgi:hypothetical protein